MLRNRRSEGKEKQLKRRSPKRRSPIIWSLRGRSMRCCVVGRASEWWERHKNTKKLNYPTYKGHLSLNSFVPCFSFSRNQTPRRQSRLFCRYYDNNHNPKYVLSPVKQQDEWDRPYIVRYLDIISDKEIEKVKQLAKPRVSHVFFLNLDAATMNKIKCFQCSYYAAYIKLYWSLSVHWV